MRLLVITAVAALALAGCANRTSPYGTTAYAPAASCDQTAGLLGGLAGAAGGGLLGNQFGKGTGKDVATAGGVLAGGAGGYTLGNRYAGC